MKSGIRLLKNMSIKHLNYEKHNPGILVPARTFNRGEYGMPTE